MSEDPSSEIVEIDGVASKPATDGMENVTISHSEIPEPNSVIDLPRYAAPQVYTHAGIDHLMDEARIKCLRYVEDTGNLPVITVNGERLEEIVLQNKKAESQPSGTQAAFSVKLD